jgi:hypothetical protein
MRTGRAILGLELPGFTSRGHCSFHFSGVETFFEPTANSLARVSGQ